MNTCNCLCNIAATDQKHRPSIRHVLSMFSIGPLGKRVVCFGHSHGLVEVLDCSVDLLDHWSRFSSEGSDATGVLTLFMARLENAKQKSKFD